MLSQISWVFLVFSSCLVGVGGVNTTADKTRQLCLVLIQFPICKFSVIFNVFETEQLQIGQFCLVRVGSVNKL